MRNLGTESVIKKSLLPKDVFRQDAPERADLAIVVGASDPDHLRHRIAAAVSLMTSGRVPRLLLSGDGRKKHPEGISEAERMKTIALKAGIPASAMFVEDSAQDTIAIARECARLLKSDGALQTVRSAILVSSAWHMHRLYLIMRRHLPRQVALSCSPATEGITAANWQTTPQGRALVENELRLIEKLAKTGY
jgi:vancomycin permeability regulator SanA